MRNSKKKCYFFATKISNVANYLREGVGGWVYRWAVCTVCVCVFVDPGCIVVRNLVMERLSPGLRNNG